MRLRFLPIPGTIPLVAITGIRGAAGGRHSIFFIANENTLVPLRLGSAFSFVRPRFLPIPVPIPLMAITGIRGAAGGGQPASAKTPLYFVSY